jgi:predicted amidohydrolase YtcJ
MNIRILALCLLCLVAAFAVQAQSSEATLILTNGRIWTADSARPYVQTVVISGDKIVAVGGNALVRRHRKPNTKVVDLKGRFAMPGINDSHVHFLGASLVAFQVDLSEVKSVEEAQRAIRKFADENPGLPWITGLGWQYSIFPEGRVAERGFLDSVVADRPVYMRAYDGHSAWTNTKAFEIAGVDENTEFSGFGELVKGADGRPTGFLKEGAMGLVSRKIPAVTREREFEALRRGFRKAAELGLTSIQNAHGSVAEAEMYDELLKSGELTLRTSFAFSVGPRTTQADIDRIAEAARRFDSPMLRMKAVKIAVDGVIESYTAAMLAPYSNKPDTSGTPSWQEDRLREVVAMADKAGLQIYIHAIGDRGVRMALDAFENAIRLNGRRDSRFRIEHIETVDAADVPRFKQLGVIASMEPIHAYPDTIGVWSANIGPERTGRGFAWKLLQDAGAKLIFSSDYPAAITMNPWRGLHNAVNRRTIDGKPPAGWLPQHRVSVGTALTAYTANGAYASFEESVKGRIAAGMFADLIVLDGNPFKMPPMKLHELKPLMTVFAGKPLHDHLTGK